MKHSNLLFQERINRLNPDQYKAATTIEGPVMVIASPGSGKTHTLSVRVGTILQKAGVEPQNILCLTFTDAGVIAIRNKLMKDYGPSVHRIHIYTYHAFCNKVIQENPDIIGIKDMALADDMDLSFLFKEIIDELPVDHPLSRIKGDPYYYSDHLKDLFNTMKMENLSLEYVVKHAQQHIDDMPNNEDYQYKRKYKDFQKGDPKETLIKEETIRMNMLIEGAKLLNTYNKKLREKRLYDYNDMLIFVMDSFNNHNYMLRKYQEQYLYTLVDEFQDTNGVQFELVNQLIRYWGQQANIFLIGDDDQLLYQFQGARMKNIKTFRATYPNAEVISFSKNYRSGSKIIDAAKQLIENNTERLHNDGFIKNMVSGKKKKGSIVQTLEFDSYYDQIAHIAEQIKKEENPSDIAVIYSKHRQVQPLIRVLEGMKIPYNTKKRINVLETSHVGSILSMMKYFTEFVVSPKKANTRLIEIMSYPFTSTTIATTQHLFYNLRKHNIQAFKEEDKETMMMSEAVRHPHLLGLQISKTADFNLFLERGIEMYHTLSVSNFVLWLINASGMLDYYKKKPEELDILNTFAKFVENENRKSQFLTPEDLLDLIRLMNSNRISISLDRSIVKHNAVNLVSSHGSKGLEYKKVYMLDCTKTWEPSRGNNSNFTWPPSVTLSGEQGGIEASRRAFFVAMTRAEEELYMCYSLHDAKEKPIQRSLFIEEVVDKTDARHINLSNKKIGETVLSLLTVNEVTMVDKILPVTRLREIMDDFVLSFSSMWSWMKCPIDFYYTHVQKIPTIEEERFVFGNAFHHAMERYYREARKRKPRQFGDPKDINTYFEEFMMDHRYKFTAQEYSKYMLRGEVAIENIIAMDDFDIHSRVEQKLSNLALSHVPIKMFIDRLDFRTHTNVVVTDYKTGQYDPNDFKEGGKFWLQSHFYFIGLFENAMNEDWFPVEAKYLFVESQKKTDKPREEIVPYTKESIRLAKEMIIQVYDEIKTLKFQGGCGECKWCKHQSYLK